MKIGQVIYIDFPHNSFKWANGLKIVVAVNGTSIDMVSLDEKGNLSLFDDGKYMKATTGINNTGIRVIEGLTYEVDSSLL